MAKPTVEVLAAFIAKHISYDANLVSEGVKCPHCGKMAREPVESHWIDHRGVLAGQIADFLGLNVYDQVDDELDGAMVNGDKEEDSKWLAENIIRRIYR